MPFCGSVGGCGAWAVSRKTPIYFIYLINKNAFNNITSDQLSSNRVHEGLKLEMVVKATFS